jgi:hypothetical protein
MQRRKITLFARSMDAVRAEKARQNNGVEPGSDSIRTKMLQVAAVVDLFAPPR